MQDFHQIQLGSEKNVNAVNVDQNLNISLKSSTKEILSYNESATLNVADIFNAERQESESYRVYGSINFMSIINGLKLTYKQIEDFFTPIRLTAEATGGTKNILNCFDVYLCYPSTGNTQISPSTFVRDYIVASRILNVEIYKAGYSKNIYFNNIYAYDFNIDFDIEGRVDSFGKPITNFYLFFNFIPGTNGNGQSESVSGLTYPSFGKTTLPYKVYGINEVAKGDFVSYVNTNFEEEIIRRMEYYVSFPYDGGRLQFVYNPFVPIKVRDFADEIISANISGGTENDFIIPSYATPIDNKGNYVWKDILVNGYIDPITGKGVDYPFVNKRHYVFNNIVLGMKPDVNDPFTANVFDQIKFGANALVNNRPSTTLNDLGNKCA